MRWEWWERETEERRARGTEKQSQDNRKSIFWVTHPRPGAEDGCVNKITLVDTTFQILEPNREASRSTIIVYILKG